MLLCVQNSNVGGYNSRGFVEVLAASQTTTTKEWFQGTADAVRQYMWLFDEACRDGVEDFLILSGEMGHGWVGGWWGWAGADKHWWVPRRSGGLRHSVWWVGDC